MPFIFIAGREMYDAYLADISDRDSFVGSVFHKVIYVNSFFTDGTDTKKQDLTYLTEKYVCQFLFPPYYRVSEDKNLREYNAYLKRIMGEDDDLKRKQREKIIIDLQNFINYLSYRSNGAPKKISRLFEEYVIGLDDIKIQNKINNRKESLAVGFNNQNLYLHFNFYSQYNFGVVTALTTPFIFAVSPYLKHFGDKLLVSSSFLIDHLYKFHSFAFSKRDLELTPEIIDINRAPELREFMNNILLFLTKSHLQEIVSGLYEFKFNYRVRKEINFLSKVKEQESAAFNFTLDESLAIKRHYNTQLNNLKKSHSNNDKPEYINSIGILQIILGDLHYFDEEYNEAILLYRDAIQFLKKEFENPETKNFNYYQFVLFLRNTLKLGAAFERKGNLDSAFMVYNELTSIVLRVRAISMNWGYDEFLATEQDVKESLGEEGAVKFQAYLKRQSHRSFLQIQRNKENKPLLPVLVKLNQTKGDTDLKSTYYPSEEYHKDKGTIVGFQYEYSEIFYNLPRNLMIEQLNQKLTLFEGVRLIYQPIIARLHIVEKNNLGGVTANDVRRAINEFDFIIKILHTKEKFLIQAEFDNKLGDLLFFKNGVLLDTYLDNKKTESNVVKAEKDVVEKDAVEKDVVEKDVVEKDVVERIYCNQKEAICSKNENVDYLGKIVMGEQTTQNKNKDFDFRAPCSACFFYMNSIQKVSETVLPNLEDNNQDTQSVVNGKNNILYKLLKFMAHEEKSENSMLSQDDYIHTLAKCFADAGDTFLSCATKKDTIAPEFLKLLLNCIKENDKVDKNKNKLYEYLDENKISKLEEALLYEYFAAWMFLHSSRMRRYTFKLSRILYILNEYKSLEDLNEEDKSEILILIKENLIYRIIRSVYIAYDGAHHQEAYSINDLLGDSNSETNNFNYQNISVFGDVGEVIWLYLSISFKLNKGTMQNNLISSPYSVIYSKLNRVFELRWKAKYNYIVYQKLFNKGDISKGDISFEDFTIFKDKNYVKFVSSCDSNNYLNEIKKIKQYLIVDSIFCFNEVLKTYQIYGTSYFSSYSAVAFAHKKLAFWCNEYEKIGDKREINKHLLEVIGALDMKTTTSIYNYELAVRNFYESLLAHREGQSYKLLISDMRYLDDDYNDSILHFAAALERYKVNIGIIRSQIDEIREKIGKIKSKAYASNSYTNELSEK